MRKLLSAGFVRLRRSKILWLSCLLLAGMEATSMLTRWRECRALGIISSLDGGFFTYAGYLGFLIAIFSAFFIGPEYSDGAIRNKLIGGCTRRDIYLTNLLLMCLAALLMCLSALLPALAVGLPLLGGFKMGAARAALTVLGTIAMSFAWSSLFTLIAMLLDHRTAAAVTALVLAMVLTLAGAYLESRLEAAPTLQGYELSVNGQIVPTEPVPNPAYLPEGPARQAARLLYDLLLGGQAVQFVNGEASRPLALAGWSLLIFALATGAGLVAFKRKDIR